MANQPGPSNEGAQVGELNETVQIATVIPSAEDQGLAISASQPNANTDALITPQPPSAPIVSTHGNVHYPWGLLSEGIPKKTFEDIYNEVVHWRRNIIMPPSGASTKNFIKICVKLLNDVVNDTQNRDIAFLL